MKLEPASEKAGVSNGEAVRPYWSVMVPVYRPPEGYLRQCLESVLQQAPGADQMQIEVVDDCSPEGDVEGLVRSIGGDRIAFSRTPKNLGLAGCWNTCIERARGEWVHLLHQDDYVLPGFYAVLRAAAHRHPDVSLLAARSFFVDGDGVIGSVSNRLQKLERGGRVVDDFFGPTPIQCPGVVVRRDFYEAHGGFRTDLRFVLDAEMWSRVISWAGGVVVPEVLSCYRTAQGNESNRLARTGENLRDFLNLYKIFASRHETFDRGKSLKFLAHLTFQQMQQFRRLGDKDALAANHAFWTTEIPLKLRLRYSLVRVGRNLLG